MLLLLYVSQGWLLYPAPGARGFPSIREGTVLRAPVQGGEEAVAFHVPARGQGRTVVHFHGNGDHLGNAGGLISELSAAGAGVLAVEYPGYGEAKGRPSEEALYAAAEAALEALRTRSGTGPDQITLWGQSLGTGVATELARRGLGSRLVLVTPFTSIADVAQDAFWYVPVRLLLRDRYDNAAKASAISAPVLIIHGTDDEVVPYAHGVALSKAFPDARLMTVEGATHNDVLDHPGVLTRAIDFAVRP